jgi:GxxExxY protein
MVEMLNRLSHVVIGCAIEVHRALGPGLLESAYEECLAHELKMASLHFERQKPVALRYKSLNLECGYRLDFLVEDKLVIELKSVEALLPIFEAQILTYMRLADKPLGLLMNFNAQVLKHGLKRFVRSPSMNQSPRHTV